MNWQPIETAPDYGVRFLGAYKSRRGEWMCDVVAWETDIVTSSGHRFPATHWMPLPAAPEDGK